MRINPLVYAFLVLAVFLGVIYGFQSAGVWSTSGRRDSQGREVQPDAADTSTIKGWMTLEQISTAYGVSVDEILQAFDLPADTPATTAVKDLESDSFSVSGLRTWLAEQSADQPASPTQTPALPTATPPLAAPSPTVSAAEPEEHSEEKEEYKVSGETTFQDLLDWGVTQEIIEKLIGGPMPDPATLVRDHVRGTGVRFAVLKEQLQVEVDKVVNP